MEDLLGLVVIVLYFILSAASSKKKKAQRTRANTAQRESRRAVQFEQAFERAPLSHAEQLRTHENAVQTDATRAAGMYEIPYGEGDDPCHEEMLGQDRAALRARTVSQQQMDEASEGEDPCHVGGAVFGEDPDDASAIEHSPIFDTEDPDAFAKDVLRGVIMSEILTRPQDRSRGTGMKRGA